MARSFISLRDRLTGAVVELLNDEHMACVHTQDGLVTILNALALYKEEGRALFPEVFIVDDLKAVLAVLPGSDRLQIGTGPRDASTMARALKQCAPLAQGGWAIYIHREAASFTYGLIRCGVHVLSVQMSDLLITKGDQRISALMVRQLAENVVELRGVGGSSLLVYFGASRRIEVSPVEALEALVTSIVSDVGERIREQTHAFYEELLSGVLRASHGTLAVVQPARKRSIPALLRDGIILGEPVKVFEPISELLAQPECLQNTRLLGTRALISGMLLSDGITVFASDGSVRAYNIFVKHPQKPDRTTQRSGGARRRTFDILCSMLGKDLDCVFMQSQDGSVDYKRGRNGR